MSSTNATADSMLADERAVNFSGVVTRAFDPWPSSVPLPCYEPERRWFGETAQRTPAEEGWFFMKPYKTGSSTAAGVHLRLAKHLARKINASWPLCKVRFDHALARGLYPNRQPSPGSFLWTIIREPSARAVSEFFHFGVGRHNLQPTDANLRAFLRAVPDQYYLQTLATQPAPNNIAMANDILHVYNFIGITERFDESMVVLQLLLGQSTAHVLYLTAKHRGGFDDGGGKRTCRYIWPSFVSPSMADYLQSEQWKAKTAVDQLLYAAANRSLDMTIDQLGRQRFANALGQFRRARAVVQETCLATTVFPCDEGGNYHNETDCLWNDSGCGDACIDRVCDELGLW